MSPRTSGDRYAFLNSSVDIGSDRGIDKDRLANNTSDHLSDRSIVAQPLRTESEIGKSWIAVAREGGLDCENPS